MARARFVIRTIHHLSLGDGDVVSRCLAAMPGVVVLGDLQPVVTDRRDASGFDPLALFHLKHPELSLSAEQLRQLFRHRLRTVVDRCIAHDRFLVVRSNSHRELSRGQRPSRSILLETLQQDFDTRSVAITRYPLDGYLEMREHYGASEVGSFDEYCMRVKRFLEAYEQLPLHHYESFVSDPQRALEEVCRDLELRWAPEASGRVTATRFEDGADGASTEVRSSYALRPFGDELLDEVRTSSTHQELCRRFDYEPDPCQEVLARAQRHALVDSKEAGAFVDYCVEEALTSKYGWDREVRRGAVVRSRLRDRYQVLHPRAALETKGPPAVDAFFVKKWMRFGNSVFQLINIIHAARQMGVSTVYCGGKHPILALERIMTPRFVLGAQPGELPQDEVILAGTFFYREGLKLDLSSNDMASILSQSLQPALRDEVTSDATGEDCLVVHIRAGDVFEETPPHPNYGQPPLAYYLRVLELTRPAQVVLVFESKSNPVIPALIAHLESVGLPYRVQSGSFVEDVSLLLGARRVAFGRGTFGWAVLALSKRVQEAFYFESLVDPKHMEALLTRGVVTRRIVDDTSEYVGAVMRNNWENTPEQRALMLEYPLDRMVELGSGSNRRLAPSV